MRREEEEQFLRSVALRTMQSVLQARQLAETELVRTKEALEEETRVLNLLNQTGRTLAAKLDLQSVLQAVTCAATQLSGANFGAFFYTQRGPGGEVLTLYTLSGAPREAFERFGHPRATPLFGPTFRGEGPVRIADVHEDPRYGAMAPHHGMPPGHLPVRSYLAVPVVSPSGAVIGGLFFGHRDPGVFTERSERLVVGVAAQAAIAIDNARLYADARRAADERARLLEAERAARAEIERVSVLKDEFLATLSHELRTPLNSILGWSKVLLLRTVDGQAQTRRGLEIIARNANEQARLVEDLLDMNRIVSGTIRLDMRCVDLAKVVLAAVEAALPSAAAKDIALRTTIDAGVLPVLGDASRLQQIVWNLLGNALKFTPRGGEIEVGVLRDSSRCESVSGTAGSVSRRSSCRTSSNAFDRPMRRRRASTAASASGCRS